MGLIKAAAEAIGGTFKDQWKCILHGQQQPEAADG